jgi:hypothetical protein
VNAPVWYRAVIVVPPIGVQAEAGKLIDVLDRADGEEDAEEDVVAHVKPGAAAGSQSEATSPLEARTPEAGSAAWLQPSPGVAVGPGAGLYRALRSSALALTTKYGTQSELLFQVSNMTVPSFGSGWTVRPVGAAGAAPPPAWSGKKYGSKHCSHGGRCQSRTLRKP